MPGISAPTRDELAEALVAAELPPDFPSPFGRWADFGQAQVKLVPRWISRAFDAAPWRTLERAALETLKRESA
jgi:hypothetical protein